MTVAELELRKTTDIIRDDGGKQEELRLTQETREEKKKDKTIKKYFLKFYTISLAAP
jgi:hypothetical protein